VRGARLAAVLLAVVPALIAGACAYARSPAPYRPPTSYPRLSAESMRLGQTLYRRDCAFCHGNEGQGTTRAPDLTGGANGPALTDFMLRTGRMPLEDADDPVRPGTSPYDDREIAALVAYLAQALDQPGPGIPTVDPEGADLAEGQVLYQEQCAACHATTGIGGGMLMQRGDEEGPLAGVHIPDLSRADPVTVGEAVRTGPGAMPRFDRAVIDDHQLDALARYVEYLRDPEDRGGAPIGRIGPIAEGAVGWALGLGLLVVFIRWVGTRRGEQEESA